METENREKRNKTTVKVAVIVSTYNGEKYINEQIESILNQKAVEVEVFIRDDGSTDGTRDTLRLFQSEYDNVHIECGTNLGYPRSFFSKLFEVGEYDYYSFSDQDDYWEEDKLYSAYNKLKDVPKEKPAIYYSNLEVCDEELKSIRVTKLEDRKMTLESITTRRSIAGCTIVFNNALYRILIKSKNPNAVVGSHDNYIMSFAYAIGAEVICDKNHYIKYRQHNSNTSGDTNGVIKRIRKEYKEMREVSWNESDLAKSLIDNYQTEISDTSLSILNEIAEIRKWSISRIRVFFSPRYTTGNISLTIIGKLKILLGLL